MKRDMEHLNLQDAFRPMPEETRDALMNAACSVKEEEIVKKKLTFSFVSVIAILLALVAVAYAATEVYHRITVNWKGETVRETEVPAGPEATAVPLADAQITILNDEDLDRMADELIRANIQWGVGGGLEWDRYRLQSGYDFGLNNLVRHQQVSKQYMSEWGWFVTFSYRF